MKQVTSQLSGFVPLPILPGVRYEGFDTVGELVDRAIRYCEQAKQSGDDYEYFFRGEEACYDKPTPSLFVNDVRKEHLYFQRALSVIPEVFYHLRTTFDRLSQMRHYGFPVRLLDVSTNVLTSWFMALDGWKRGWEKYFEQTFNIVRQPRVFPVPRVIVFRVPKQRMREAESDLVTNLACLAKVGERFTCGHLWHEIRQERADFRESEFIKKFDDLFENWHIRPRLSNPRVAIQQGSFIVFGLHKGAGPRPFINEDVEYHKRTPSGEAFNPVLGTGVSNSFGVTPSPITIEAILMPSDRYTTSDALRNFVEKSFRDLSTIGIDPHTMYRDNLENHARYVIESLR